MSAVPVPSMSTAWLQETPVAALPERWLKGLVCAEVPAPLSKRDAAEPVLCGQPWGRSSGVLWREWAAPCLCRCGPPARRGCCSPHCSPRWPLADGRYGLGQEGATSPYLLLEAFYLQRVWAGLWVLAVRKGYPRVLKNRL